MSYLQLTPFMENEELDTYIGVKKILGSNNQIIDSRFFQKGKKRQSEGLKKVVLCINSDPKVTLLRPRWTDHIHIVGVGHIFSEKAFSLFRERKIDNIEFFSVEFSEEDNVKCPFKYYLANFISPIDCINYSQSKIRKIGRNVRLINKLVIDPKKVPNELQTFVLDISPSKVFFRCDLIEVLKNQKISGCVWRKPEDIQI